MTDIVSTTSLTMLARLRQTPHDAKSWQEFVNRYGKRIHAWCVGWGLQPNDAEDVTQSVLLEIAKQMKDFEHRPNSRFRGWIKTIARRAWLRFVQLRTKQIGSTGDDRVAKLLSAAEAREDFVAELEKECEQQLMHDAMKLVRQRVEEHTWKAFEQTAIEGLAGKTVATQLGMNVGTVYVAKSKVLKLIQDEIALLDAADPATYD